MGGGAGEPQVSHPRAQVQDLVLSHSSRTSDEFVVPPCSIRHSVRVTLSQISVLCHTKSALSPTVAVCLHRRSLCAHHAFPSIFY